jgi:hypothetical protein
VSEYGNATLEYAFCDNVAPLLAYASSDYPEFQIKPDAGEQIGDCVTLLYNRTLIGSVTASGTATSQAGVGGQYDPEIFPQIAFTSPSQILVNGIRIFIYGPKVISAPPDDSFNDTSSGSITVLIGDTIRMESGPGFAVFGSLSSIGSGEAKASARLEISVGPCPPPPVPALSDGGVLVFAFILLTTTLYLLRKRKVP